MFDQDIWQSAYDEAIRAGESTRTAREYADEYERENRADPNEWSYVEPAMFDAAGRL